jgi:hypothetical protein
MDVEHELRKAMAEHVADVTAPASLARDVRRGNRRVVRFRVLAVAAAAAAVAFAAGVPVYQAVRPEPVGATGSATGGGQPGGPAVSSQGPVQLPAKPTAGTRTLIAPGPGVASSSQGRGSGGSGQAIHRFLTYVPAGIRQTGQCAKSRSADRDITYCRWSGPGGLVELKLIRGHGLAGPADVGFPPTVPIDARVHDQPAIRGAWSEAGSQISWVERPDIGVWIGVSPNLNGRLMRIAEGVRLS